MSSGLCEEVHLYRNTYYGVLEGTTARVDRKLFRVNYYEE